MKKSKQINTHSTATAALCALLVAILPGCNPFNWIKEKVSTPTPHTQLSTQPAIPASSTVPVPNSYNGIPITDKTLYILSSEYSPLPSQARHTLDQWLAQSGNKELLKHLLTFHFENQQELGKKFGQDMQRLQHAQVRNESGANYVFRLPNLDYFIKIAGPINRTQSALIERGFWPGQQPTRTVMDEIIAGKIPTYQTASRAAYFLILEELKRKKHLGHIAVQDTHLIYYPGAHGKPNDDRVLILEKALPNNVERLTSATLRSLSNETLAELVEAIIGAGLWSIRNNIFLSPNKQILYLIDLEQPNNSAPKDFFHKDDVRYFGNINAGLEQLFDLLQGSPEQLQFVRNLVESSPVVQSPQYHARYKRELLQMLDQKAPR